MINFYDVLIELLPKVWYFLPLIIVLSFIKIYIEKEKRRKAQKEFHLKNEENGKKFEKLTGKRFEELGYKVIYNGLEKGKLDQGIDLICYKENEILLIQCKNFGIFNRISYCNSKRYSRKYRFKIYSSFA